MEIHLSSRFKKSFRKPGHSQIQKRAVLKTSVFKDNPFAPKLDTHKLHGEKKEEWAFSVDYSYRISFVFVGTGAILFTDIGTHDMYK